MPVDDLQSTAKPMFKVGDRVTRPHSETPERVWVVTDAVFNITTGVGVKHKYCLEIPKYWFREDELKLHNRGAVTTAKRRIRIRR